MVRSRCDRVPACTLQNIIRVGKEAFDVAGRLTGAVPVFN
jgi:hypothetical protein